MKILVCAFSCAKDPDMRFGSGNGGEGVLGWNLVFQLGRFFDVTVLTHIDNRKAIEIAIENSRGDRPMNFQYFDIPSFLNFTKKNIQIYSYLWQIKAYFIAKELHKKNYYDIFWHITYANDWMASHIGALLPIAYFRGPGGGSQRIPKNFLQEFGKKERIKEVVRSFGQWVFKHDPFYILGQNRAKRILICNQESFDALPDKWRKKAVLFPVNGISQKDLTFLKEKVIGGEENFLIFSAGKLIKLKGFDLAIKSFKKFSEEINDAVFVIAGDGPELSNLKILVKELNLEEKVIFKAWLSREDLLLQMSACDIFIFESLREGGGAVVVEAMAAGKPVVCFNLAGPGFHIDEKCGIKIEASNPEQAINGTAQALRRLYFSKELRTRLGNEARKKIEKEYDWNKLGERLLQYIKN